VIYHRDLSGSLLAQNFEDHGISNGELVTDKLGRYSARVHPGIYDVCVMMNSFTPQCKKIAISAEKPAFPTFRLRVDPLITKQLGDVFPTK
jgi:hypothetical protein